jgi:hypothetical protein
VRKVKIHHVDAKIAEEKIIPIFVAFVRPFENTVLGGQRDPHPSLSRKRARVHISCSLDRKIPSPILMGEGEGNFIVCGRA